MQLSLFFLPLLTLLAADEPAAKKEDGNDGKTWVFVGTYTGKNSKGIYRLELDLATGKLSTPELAAETVNPTFLALHPSGRFLYSVNEIGKFQGKPQGAVSAFEIDPKTGMLTLLNQEASAGVGPCHLVVDKAGKHVLVANYGSGSVGVLPLQKDGVLDPAISSVQHKGFSVNKQRQEGPHAHSINLDPANRFAFVADLGLDRIMIYRFDADKGHLTPHDAKLDAVAVEPGAGPRHFTFHANGQFAYVINELNSTVTAFAYDADKGTLKTLQTLSTLPKDFKGQNGTAEVKVHPSGKFLYGSNRGHDSIAVFAIDLKTGTLTHVANQGQGIKAPRNFNIDPSGRFMIVANQEGHNLLVFRIDPETGELTPTGESAAVSSPVCVRMLGK